MSYHYHKILFVLVAFVAVNTLFALNLHVAKNGNDSNSGDILSPLLTVSKAASLAYPGDSILIHAGTYREYVNPPRGGTSDSQRITYVAAQNEEVYIKGSELINNWIDCGNGTWKIVLANSYFNGYNPYQLKVDGDFQNYGQWHHRGDVYLNNGALSELQTLAQVKDEPYTWFTTSNSTETTIYSNFGNDNPNDQLTEINVRELLFFTSRADIDYITIDGIRFLHAAPNWQAPNTGPSDPNRLLQKGAVGSNMGKGWIIQNCEISHSKTAGIMMGESADNQNTFTDVNAFGDHLIKNNVITRCGEYGIAGQKGLSRSTIIGNRIEDINYRNEFSGYEPAGIKVWNCVDVLIENNLVQNCISTLSSTSQSYCIWIDYGNQGIRITRNILIGSSKTTTPLFLEANMGVNLVDNNVIIDPAGHSVMVFSGGSVFAHNLFINTGFEFAIQQFDNGGSGARRANSLQKHTLIYTNLNTPVEIIYNKMYNNIFAGGNGPFNFGTQSGVGNVVDKNLYLDGTKSGTGHTNSTVSNFDFTYTINQKSNGIDFDFKMDNSFEGILTSYVNHALVGVVPLPNQSIEDKYGSYIEVNTDFNNQSRITPNPIVGPLQSLVTGLNTLTITTLIEPSSGQKYLVPISNPNYGSNPQLPFSGSAIKLPGVVKVQNYDLGGPGISFNDDDKKEGNLEIRKGDEVDFVINTTNDTILSCDKAGEWLEFTVTIEPGMYEIRLKASSGEIEQGGKLTFFVNNKQIALIDSINTGDWNSYHTYIEPNIPITSTKNGVLRISTSGGYHLGDITFVKTDTSLPKINSLKYGVKIYPNPIKDFLFVETESGNVSTLKVFTLDGIQIVSERASALDLSFLNTGLYVLTVNDLYSYSIVKE